MAKKSPTLKSVETLKHDEAKRKNIPTAEFQSVIEKEQESPTKIRYPRDTDLDPQLVWRGKDEQDWTDLVVHAPPLYIQEKVHPKVLIDDLLRETKEREHAAGEITADLFADFNGIPKGADKTEFYQHDQNWSNRMILGDSLQVMASLTEREGLRGKVQCIFFDPPYGIRFNSNFQWSTSSRDVKDGKADHITREPEQVKAFRDTWRDGIHSYLTYLRDRLTVARDLLSESGSMFVQIGDENVHRVRAVMDEVFGDENFVSLIAFKKTSSASSELLAGVCDYLVWFAKSKNQMKYRTPYYQKSATGRGGDQYNLAMFSDGRVSTVKATDDLDAITKEARLFRHSPLTSQRPPGNFPVELNGRIYHPKTGYWKTGEPGMKKLRMAGRLMAFGNTLEYVRYLEDFPAIPMTNVWEDTVTSGFADPKVYVVQTGAKIVQRCILMATDPGDLVLDPTCGSGTTAYVSEQWGRRWITIDTSRVALALARARVMGARYPFYLLADSREGKIKEAEINLSVPSSQAVHGDIRQGFVYESVPHITLKSIANNEEIDVIWEKWQPLLVQSLKRLNSLVGGLKKLGAKLPKTDQGALEAVPDKFEEWTVPRESPLRLDEIGLSAVARYREHLKDQGKQSQAGSSPDDDAEEPSGISEAPVQVYFAMALANFWHLRTGRQKEIDKSINAKAEFEYLYDKPYDDKKKVRVAGPFTVESLSPHRVLGWMKTTT